MGDTKNTSTVKRAAGQAGAARNASNPGPLYRFEIDGFYPHTLPAQILLKYIEDVIRLLGGKERVYLVGIEESSAVPVFQLSAELEQKTEQRLFLVKQGQGPREAQKAFDAINNRLGSHKTSGRLLGPTKKNVLQFPGAGPRNDETLGPVEEFGYVQGEIVQIGGRDESISVHLRTEDDIVICNTTRDQGRRLAKYIFGRTIRIYGQGQWNRLANGRWKLSSFVLHKYEPVDEAPLASIFDQAQKKFAGHRVKG
jgi:hypothetical protein